MSLSPRAAIQPFLAMEVAREASQRAATGARIIRMDVGQPCFGAPERAIAAAERALRSDPLGYSEGLGALDLRRALARWYGTRHGLDIDPARIVITTGASGAFQLAFLALFADGARVALAAPGYPPYRHILTSLGFTPVTLEARLEAGLQIEGDAVRNAGPLAGVLAASPANPTGTTLSFAALQDLAGAAREAGAALISDEIYDGLCYDGATAHCALRVDPDAIVINSFSKYWAMTGWRVGWIVAPERLVKPIERLAQNLFVAPPTLAQIAAEAALGADDECEARLAVYAQSRRLLIETLPRLGLPILAPPDGAFYALVDISAHAQDSLAFCRRMLDEAGVAMTPGLDFDARRGAGWARLAYARRPDEIAEGLERLEAALR